MSKSSGNPVSSRGIEIQSGIQSGSALDFFRTKTNKTWSPTLVHYPVKATHNLFNLNCSSSFLLTVNKTMKSYL